MTANLTQHADGTYLDIGYGPFKLNEPGWFLDEGSISMWLPDSKFSVNEASAPVIEFTAVDEGVTWAVTVVTAIRVTRSERFKAKHVYP